MCSKRDMGLNSDPLLLNANRSDLALFSCFGSYREDFKEPLRFFLNQNFF